VRFSSFIFSTRFLKIITLAALAFIAFPNKIFAQYCTTAFEASCLESSPAIADYINSFSTTGAVVNISNLNTGCNGSFPENYTFHPNMNLSVAQGCNFSATMSCATFSQGFAIWIDWNQDFDFNDAGEYCYNSGAAIGSNA